MSEPKKPTKAELDATLAEFMPVLSQAEVLTGVETWGSHPEFTQRDWRQDVEDRNTTLGYHHWLVNKLYQQCEDEDDSVSDS